MDRVEDEKQKTDPPQVEESAPELETASIPPADVASPQQTAPQPTETSTQSTKTRTSGGTRSVCAMHKVVIKKARGENFKVRFNQVGLPVGDGRHKLQSYLGMLARTTVPIDIPSWPKVDPKLKEKLWNDLQDTFEVTPESQKRILQSAGAKWRNFKAKLTAEHVLPYIGQKKKLSKPPKQYAFVENK
nr:PREDICTED: uncharacterized protein LOC108210888 [Daucus carota subsp. sativus]